MPTATYSREDLARELSQTELVIENWSRGEWAVRAGQWGTCFANIHVRGNRGVNFRVEVFSHLLGISATCPTRAAANKLIRDAVAAL